MKNLDVFERKRLEYVLKLVKDEIEKNSKLFSKLLQDTEDEEVIYNMSRTYDTKINNLKKSLLSPYFARVDFKADDEKEIKKV